MFARQGIRFSAHHKQYRSKRVFGQAAFRLAAELVWVRVNQKKKTHNTIFGCLFKTHTHISESFVQCVCVCARLLSSLPLQSCRVVFSRVLFWFVYILILFVFRRRSICCMFFFFIFIPFSLLFHRLLLPFTRCSVQCSQFSLSSVLMCIGAFFVDFFVCFGIRQNKVWTREEEKYILSFFLRLPQFRLWCSACVSSYFDILE